VKCTRAISPDGTQVAFVPDEADPQTLIISNLDGTNRRNVLEVSNPPDVGWSPDGSHLAVVTRSSEESTLHLFSMSDPSSVPVELFAEPMVYTLPQWSNDGSRFVFLSYQPTRPISHSEVDIHVYQLERPDEGFVEATFHLTSEDAIGFDSFGASISPDGQQYLVSAFFGDFDYASCVVNLNDGSVLCSPRYSVYWGSDWSPDSTLLAFGYHTGIGDYGIAVMSTVDGAIRKVFTASDEYAIFLSGRRTGSG
jgi:Tol biopolymer transport system component